MNSVWDVGFISIYISVVPMEYVVILLYNAYTVHKLCFYLMKFIVQRIDVST